MQTQRPDEVQKIRQKSFAGHKIQVESRSPSPISDSREDEKTDQNVLKSTQKSFQIFYFFNTKCLIPKKK